MIKIENGQAESFHLDSGHYMPKLPQLENFLSRVAAKNVDLSQLEISTKNINQDEIDTLINKYSQ
ncbi:hypothetical protein DMW17_25530 [Vibrio parahaemolyticus]|nr:hypothetical protein [Vibrio parahaemolyticus]